MKTPYPDRRCICGHPKNMHYGGAKGNRCMKIITQHYSGDVKCTCVEFRPEDKEVDRKTISKLVDSEKCELDGKKQSHAAEGWLHNAEGTKLARMCAKCAQLILDEYQEKLEADERKAIGLDHWYFEPDRVVARKRERQILEMIDDIRVLHTSDYPTRYRASDQPGVVFVQDDQSKHELAVGLSCHFTEPIYGREQHNFTDRFDKFQEALDKGIRWVAETRVDWIINGRERELEAERKRLEKEEEERRPRHAEIVGVVVWADDDGNIYCSRQCWKDSGSLKLAKSMKWEGGQVECDICGKEVAR